MKPKTTFEKLPHKKEPLIDTFGEYHRLFGVGTMAAIQAEADSFASLGHYTWRNNPRPIDKVHKSAVSINVGEL